MRRAVHLQAAQHVLYPHHRIVHQFANGDGETAQRHGVDGQAKVVKHQDRHHDAHGNGRQRNEGGAGIQQKQVKHDSDDTGSSKNLALERVNRYLDECRLAHGDLGFAHAGRQTTLHFRQGSLYLLGQLDGICVGLLLYPQDHRGLAIQACITPFDGGCKQDIGHLAELDGFAIAKGDGQTLQIF